MDETERLRRLLNEWYEPRLRLALTMLEKVGLLDEFRGQAPPQIDWESPPK